jgi:hypothetical protein
VNKTSSAYKVDAEIFRLDAFNLLLLCFHNVGLEETDVSPLSIQEGKVYAQEMHNAVL